MYTTTKQSYTISPTAYNLLWVTAWPLKHNGQGLKLMTSQNLADF